MTMRKLTSDEVRKLAGREGIRRMGVENFLSTMGTDYDMAANNLLLDASLYHWNASTASAIRAGIALACRPVAVR